MNLLKPFSLACGFALIAFTTPVLSQTVVQDGGVSLSAEEFAYAVSLWTPQMREVAIADEGDRLELINMSLANKKVAEQAEQVVREQPDLLMRYTAGIQAFQRDFVLRNYSDNLEVPDFTELAQEQYALKKEKIALNPERRLSSHILFASPPGIPRDDALARAGAVLEELQAGADFVEMVSLHSEEPNAKAKQGLFNLWMTYGDKNVSPPYSKAVFEIEKVGDYSGLVQTQFGVHIIRLDGIKEKTYKPFDEVKAEIITDMEKEYRSLAMREFVGTFNMTDDAVIDAEAVEQILAPYKPEE